MMRLTFISFGFAVFLTLTAFAEEKILSEEIGGFTPIYGAYDVSKSNDVVDEEATGDIAYDALLPFLNKEARELVPEHDFTARFLLIDRRSDRQQTLVLSNSIPTMALENTNLYFHVYQCVKNARDIEGNDVAFLTVTEDDVNEDMRIVQANVALPEEEGVPVLSEAPMPFFSGWMYKLYPSVHVLTHPVYSVKFLGCEMQDIFAQ